MATNTNWYKEWFDTELYEKLYAHRNEAEADKLANLIQELLPAATYPEVLDLGCGRGRHAIKLAQRGYRVTGVDLSPNAIGKARRYAREEKLDHIDFKTGDMRETLDQKFDLIVNLFTTFGYFEKDEENKKVLSGVYEMLKKEGYFLIDYLNAERVKNKLNPHEEGNIDKLTYQIERNLVNGSVEKHITFQNDNGRTQTYREKVKLYDKAWFLQEFSRLNFTVERIMGNYAGASFMQEESPRLIFLVKKAKQK